MDEKKMTRAEALELAIAALEDNPDAVEVLKKMHASVTKPRKRKTDDTKRLANIARGEEFVAKWEGDTFTAKDVKETLNLSSIQQAIAVCKAMEFEQVPSTEKVIVYTAA